MCARARAWVVGFHRRRAPPKRPPPSFFPFLLLPPWLAGPKFTTKFTSNHKGPVNVCAFSADGRVAATGSADSSIKILDVAKMRAYGDAGPGGGVRPVYRTLYDHTQV